MASARGTAMELGIGPLLTATILMQLLVAGKIIDGVNHSLKEDRIALQTATKLLAMILSFIMATAHVLSGAYGSLAALGSLKIVLLIVQLFGGCMVGLILDELLQKGFGIGSGLSLFPAVLISSDLVSKVNRSDQYPVFKINSLFLRQSSAFREKDSSLPSPLSSTHIPPRCTR